LLYKLNTQYWPALKSVLNYLNYLYPHELNIVGADDNVEKMLEEL